MSCVSTKKQRCTGEGVGDLTLASPATTVAPFPCSESFPCSATADSLSFLSSDWTDVDFILLTNSKESSLWTDGVFEEICVLKE